MQKNKPNIFDNQAISAEKFLSNYWQKKPYLFRSCDINLSCLPRKNDLFKLAAKDDAQSRIIYSIDKTNYQVVYDHPEMWLELSDHEPTLLVSDIEKWHLPASEIISYFPFIKSWRFDDLMMSYAPKGASVGAHLDQYDVFLLQVEGKRKWLYDDNPPDNYPLQDNSELAIIDNYKHQCEHTLDSGDILYLPPGHAHHGISLSDDCLTCSIGLRSPSYAEIIEACILSLIESPEYKARLKDHQTTLNAYSNITQEEIETVKKLLTKLTKTDDAKLTDMLGRFLSQYRSLEHQPQNQPYPKNFSNYWTISPFYTLVSYVDTADTILIFIDDTSYLCSDYLGNILSTQKVFKINQKQLLKHEVEWVRGWIETGIIIPVNGM